MLFWGRYGCNEVRLSQMRVLLLKSLFWVCFVVLVENTGLRRPIWCSLSKLFSILLRVGLVTFYIELSLKCISGRPKRMSGSIKTTLRDLELWEKTAICRGSPSKAVKRRFFGCLGPKSSKRKFSTFGYLGPKRGRRSVLTSHNSILT